MNQDNKISIFKNDLPSNYTFSGDLSIDTEAMGLKVGRDRLCLIQMCDAKQKIAAVHFHEMNYEAPNLREVLSNSNITKIMHFARFDARIIQEYLNVEMDNIFCTHIASRLARTYTNNHSLKELCRELLNINLSKHATCTDWGASKLSKEQINYAKYDVKYLHELRNKITDILEREGRLDLALKLFKCLPARIDLDLCGWDNIDIFAHYTEK